MLTIAYLSARKDPMMPWFFDSLQRETGGDYTGIKIVVVDRWSDERHPSPFDLWPYNDGNGSLVHVPPKPSVWQGPHRLTKADYFAQCNARNTALCLAPDGWIALVDDLSVLMPGWINGVREAMKGGYVACGAYRKVKNMMVERGELVSFTDHPAGVDHRFKLGNDHRAIPCNGNWAFGCSLALPVEAALSVGGWPEALCDSLGYEDVAFGKMLENRGYHFRYDKRMLTYESEELHSQLPVMRREDPCRGDPKANPRDDMSHALLRAVSALKFHPNYFGDEGIRGLRARVLAGAPFPIVQIPEHRWYDAKPVRSLPADVEEAVDL